MQAKKQSIHRRINLIQYSEGTRKANLAMKKGRQSQTAALNINLKTLNKNELLKMPILGSDEKNIIADYLLEKANFSTTRKLFGVQETSYKKASHTNILKYMQDFYESSRLIQKILQNQNMDFPNKMILLKFVQKIRVSTIYPRKHTNWKDKF